MLTRYYLDGEQMRSREYLYIHFFSRSMKNKINEMDRILIYPDCYMNFYHEMTRSVVERYGKKSKLAYYYRVVKQNQKRLSLKKIASYFRTKSKYEKSKKALD